MKTSLISFKAIAVVSMFGLLVMGAAAKTIEVKSGNKTSGSGANWSEEYRISASAPEGKKIISDRLELVKDRRCGAWSECRVITRTESLVVWGFKLQGHNEGKVGFLYFGNPNNGERDSEAILTIETN
jgi:hypothetical protein